MTQGRFKERQSR